MKDQTVKAAELPEIEAQLRQLREENLEMRKRLHDFSSLEVTKKGLETKLEQLEQRVRLNHTRLICVYTAFRWTS